MPAGMLWSQDFCMYFAEYDSDTSCHYKMELSYDDDDDDDIPRVSNVACTACYHLYSK